MTDITNNTLNTTLTPTKKRSRNQRNRRKPAMIDQHLLSDTASSSSDGETSASSSSSSTSPATGHSKKSGGSRNTRGTRRGTRGGRNGSKNKAKRSKEAQALEQVVVLSAEQQAQYVALDCEMVGVGTDGLLSALARVTLVDWNGHVLLDEYVRPDRPVTDYRTFVSGITPAHLEAARFDNMAACRAAVAQVVNDKILVGHGLKSDLQALGMRHPWYMTRDTAKYEKYMQVRFDDGVLWPRKLRDLAKEFLHRDIQAPGVAHCPMEDALTAMDLYKHVRAKWEKIMAYKIQKTREIEKAAAEAAAQASPPSLPMVAPADHLLSMPAITV